MTVQGYREIVGDDDVLRPSPRRSSDEFAYGNISTPQFIDVARQQLGLDRRRARLCSTEYFQQWLYGETRPTIVPDSFGSTSAPALTDSTGAASDADAASRQPPRTVPTGAPDGG